MLPKINRLTRLEVEQIKRSRITPISGQYFGLVDINKAGEPKFAVIVSNKIIPSAVIRNRIRRTVYNVIHPMLAQQKGWYLLLAKKNIVEVNNNKIEKDIVYLLNKIRNPNIEIRKNI